MTDADAECTETQIWLDFALDCKYIDQDLHSGLYNDYAEIGRMLGSMTAKPERFLPKG